MSKLTRDNAILPFHTVYDYSDKIGFPVELQIGSTVNVALWESGAPAPVGVILGGDAEQASVALCHGGLSGTVKVKLVEAVSPGDLLYLAQNNGVAAFASYTEQNFAGNTFLCAQALEAGVEGELVEAVLFRPEAVTIA